MKGSSCFTATTRPAPRLRLVLGLFGFVSVALLLGGCLSRPSIKTQTFAFSIPSPAGTNNAPEVHVLAIRALQISPPFDGRPLVYRTGDFSYERDPYAEFLSSPAEELAGSISTILVADGCFSAVVGMGSAAKPDTMVEINVNQLYGDIREPASPFAVLAVQVIFVKATNDLPGKVILQRSYWRRVPVKSATPAEFMKGWNEALVEIFSEVKSDLRSRKNLRV